MTNYILISDKSAAPQTVYAFKVSRNGYQPVLNKTQREQFTVTGKLDIQVGPAFMTWALSSNVYGDTTGTFTITTGSLINNVTTAKWGSAADLITLARRSVPPDNIYYFRDFDGTEYKVVFVGSVEKKPMGAYVAGSDSKLIINFTLKETIE